MNSVATNQVIKSASPVAANHAVIMRVLLAGCPVERPGFVAAVFNQPKPSCLLFLLRDARSASAILLS